MQRFYSTPIRTLQASQTYILNGRQLQILSKIHSTYLYDIQGQKVWSSTDKTELIYDLSELPVGPYVLHIEQDASVQNEAIYLW